MKQLLLILATLAICTSPTFAQTSSFGGGSLNLKSSAAPAAASWEQEVHDFGQIAQNEPTRFVFTVTNTGQQPLVINQVKPSCGCTAADYTRTEIAPGETGTVTAEYNAKSMGMFNKTLTVFTNAQETPYVLRIRGEVVSPSDL